MPPRSRTRSTASVGTRGRDSRLPLRSPSLLPRRARRLLRGSAPFSATATATRSGPSSTAGVTTAAVEPVSARGRSTSSPTREEGVTTCSSRGRASLVTREILLVCRSSGPAAGRLSPDGGEGERVGRQQPAQHLAGNPAERAAARGGALRPARARTTGAPDVLLAADAGPVLVVAVARVRVGAVDDAAGDLVEVGGRDRPLAGQLVGRDVPG